MTKEKPREIRTNSHRYGICRGCDLERTKYEQEGKYEGSRKEGGAQTSAVHRDEAAENGKLRPHP
jgi:hypothetical protein